MSFLIRIWTSLFVFFALQSIAHAATIRFHEDVNQKTVTNLVTEVAQVYKAGDRNITIDLDSDGGNVGSALWANTELKKYGVNTLVKGTCASSCTVLFAAGKTRTASNSAQFMFHKVTVKSIARSALYNKKKNPNGMTPQQVALKYSNNWLASVHAVSPALASRLSAKKILLTGEDTFYSGRDLRTTGYVND